MSTLTPGLSDQYTEKDEVHGGLPSVAGGSSDAPTRGTRKQPSRKARLTDNYFTPVDYGIDPLWCEAATKREAATKHKKRSMNTKPRRKRPVSSASAGATKGNVSTTWPWAKLQGNGGNGDDHHGSTDYVSHRGTPTATDEQPGEAEAVTKGQAAMKHKKLAITPKVRRKRPISSASASATEGNVSTTWGTLQGNGRNGDDHQGFTDYVSYQGTPTATDERPGMAEGAIAAIGATTSPMGSECLVKSEPEFNRTEQTNRTDWWYPVTPNATGTSEYGYTKNVPSQFGSGSPCEQDTAKTPDSWMAAQLKSFTEQQVTGQNQSFIHNGTRYTPATSLFGPNRKHPARDFTATAGLIHRTSLSTAAPPSQLPIPSIHVTSPDLCM